MAGRGQDNHSTPAATARGVVSAPTVQPRTLVSFDANEHSAHPVPSPASLHLHGLIHWGIELADWMALEEGWEC